MLKQSHDVSGRRRRSGSISLVLIASTVMVAGCDQRVSAGDVAYRNNFRSLEDCRRDYGDDCTPAPGGTGGHGGYYGPYILNSGTRPMASANSAGIEPAVLNTETASRINSGSESVRGSFTSRGGFGGEGGGFGGGEGGGE